MKHVLELLQRELLFENQCRADAINSLNGDPSCVEGLKGSNESTRIAFIESKRIAEERIPQLVSAIDLIQSGWDFITNTPRYNYGDGIKSAFQNDVI